MTAIKPGLKLKSAVCSAEVMVIKAPAGASLTCGGAPMIGAKDDAPAGAALDPQAAGGCQVGKRYVNAEQSLEVLCTKAGEGSLAADGTALELKEAKKLPSSD
ncbi:MAG: hypothetical protein H6993_07260 [Pseudomonadales bacterium]|nr:hypothetical protein [Pseudomonadales bacterium]MCP5183744.1 hypothetical protein [Pseudomonadales bacterium]